LLAQKPSRGATAQQYFESSRTTDFPHDYEQYMKGTINPNLQKMFQNEKLKRLYLDFARTVREVKKYFVRYETPSISSKIIDISSVNPKYMIYGKPQLTSYGGDLIVANASKEPITLGSEDYLPLYITGTIVEELSTGNVNLKDFYQKIENDGLKTTDLAFNKSVYGDKTFNVDSELIQNIDQSNKMLRWIISNCSRERLNIKLEIFANPLLELGDKVKIFSKARGYYKNNPEFGEKTFVISDISYSVEEKASKMNISLIEVGEQ
jgi:hypothetical protein